MKKIFIGGGIIAIAAALIFGFYLKSARADSWPNQNQIHGFFSDWPMNKGHDNGGGRNGGIFNPDKELSPSACGDNLGRPVIDVTERVQNDADSGVTNYWAFDYFNRHIQVWPTGNWNVVGTYKWSVLGTYLHDIIITTQNYDGTFSGTGGYPSGDPNNYQATEKITGQVSGNTITITTLYAGSYNPGYTVTATGTIDSNGTISGNSPWAWTMTVGKAKPVYCAIVKYDGNFYAVPGQTSPQGTVNIDTPTNAPVNGDMSGGYRAMITAAFNPIAGSSAWPTIGNVGTTNYQCNLQDHCPGRIDWVAQYFSNYNPDTDFTQPWWGWKYDGGSHGTWRNECDSTNNTPPNPACLGNWGNIH